MSICNYVYLHGCINNQSQARVVVPLLAAAARLLQARGVFEEVGNVRRDAGGSWRVLETLISSPDEILAGNAVALLRAMVYYDSGGGPGWGGSTPSGPWRRWTQQEQDAAGGRGAGEGAGGKGAGRAAGVERAEQANRLAVLDAEMLVAVVERGCGGVWMCVCGCGWVGVFS